MPPYSANSKRYQTRWRQAQAIDDKEWDRIVEVFRKWHCRITMVAQELGWHEARTRRCYHRGYPSLGLPPIKVILAQDSLSTEEVRAQRATIEAQLPEKLEVKTEKAVVRHAATIAKLEKKRLNALLQLEDQREKTRKDAISARADEAMLVSLTRRNALALNGVTHKMLMGALKLSESIETELIAAAKDKTLPVEKKLAMVKSAASIARFNSEASMLAVKAERMVLGQPIDAIGEEGPAAEAGALDQAERWINITVQALQRAKKRGVLSSGEPAAAEEIIDAEVG